MPNNIEKLYQNLKADGYQLGTLDEFTRNMSDSTKADKLYQNLSADGYQLGSREDFFGKIRPQQPQQSVQPIAQQPQPAAQSQQQPATTKQTYTPSWQDQLAFGMTLGNAQYAANNATKGIEQMKKDVKNASPFGSGNVGLGNNQNLRRGNRTFDAEKGQFVYTYLTSDGREFRDEYQANNAQANLDAVANNVRYEETMKSLGIDTKSLESKDYNKMLGDAYMEREAILKKLKEDKEGERDVRDLIMSGGYDPTSNERIEQRNTYNAALRMLDRRINALETARDNGGFWSGTADVLTDSSNYSFGLTDLADSKEMNRLKEKIDKARESGLTPQLTDSEKALARNYMLNQQAEQLNKDNWWYNAGKGFGETLSFMKDFALTGGGFASLAKGGMALGAKGGAKLASKVLGDYTTKNLGTKALGKTMEYIGKGVGLAAGAEAGGFMLNNTAQFASSAADIINKQTGNLTIGKDGNLSFEGGKDLGMAMLQSQIQRTGENGSELVGLAFDAVPGILGKVIQRTTVGKALKKLTDNALWKKGEGLLNYLGVQSVWGEGMEEEYGMARTEILNRLTDGSYAPEGSGLFDMERQIDTWKTVGLTSMILRVPAMVVSGTQTANYYGNMYNLNTSDRNMRNTFGDDERYQSVKAMLDGADNQNIAGVLNNLMSNAELSREEKESMFMYANDLIKLRGFNIGNVVAAANGLQEPPKVSGYNIRGLHVDEVDKDGNVLASHDYETSDDLKAGLYELQQRRVDENLQSDISVMKARPNQQYREMLIQYCVQTGVEPSVFEEMLSKPSMERTEVEHQIVAPFADLLHETVYDNTMLHEEQSQQDGEYIADADSIDIEQGGEQGMNLNAQWMAAQGNRRQLFDNNEELREEVEQMENAGLTHQEIISRLETFKPEEVQSMIDYYNTKAKYEGYINRMNDKINEEAANARQSHTFKGTINGQADLRNVYTITDGVNHYYLVSGNVATDSQGRITGSTSGLIIGMDLDGSFVRLNESDGYSVEPVTMSLDQFEEAERIRLQEQVTSVIDPNGTLSQPEESVPQPAETGTQEEAPVPETEETGTQEPAVSIESVTDKDGIKRYEKGIPVDDAIADMEANGDDVNEIADASISEAQEVINKINNKQTKTRLDIEKRKNAQRTIDYYNKVKERWAERNKPQETVSDNQLLSKYFEMLDDQTKYFALKIPKGEGRDNYIFNAIKKNADVFPKFNRDLELKNAKANLNNPDPATRLAAIRTVYGNRVNFNNGTISDINEELKKDAESLTKRDNITKYSMDGYPIELQEKLREFYDNIGMVASFDSSGKRMILSLKSEENVNVESEAPNNPGNDVPLQEKGGNKSKAKTADEKRADRIKALKEQYGEDFDDDFTYAQSAKELASMYVGRNRTLSREDLAKELGYPLGLGTDEVWAETLLAKKGEGMSTWDVAHAAWQSDENPIIDSEGNRKFTDQEIHDALIAVFQNARQKSDIIDYAINAREEAARQKAEGRRRQEEEDAENQVEVEPMTAEQLAEMKNNLPFMPMTDEEAANDQFLQNFDENGKYNYKFDDNEHNNRGQRVDGKNEQGGVGSRSTESIRSGEGAESSSLENLRRPEEGESEQNGADRLADVLQSSEPVSVRTRTDRDTGSNNQTEKQGSNDSEIQGNPESVEDPYLQPRNAEEEKIIANVIAQLQQEIGDAANEQNKARSELEKAMARESERATDMFGNDNALNQPGQLFDNSDMPVDQSAEGVERRTSAEREKLQEATNKVNQLESLEERNSRIRGALDNYRRQTTIETNDPMEAIEQAANQFQQEQEEKKPEQKPKSAKVEVGSDYGKNNKVVTQQEYNDLVDEWRRLHGQLNSGLATAAQLGFVMSRMAAFHIEAGARKFADFVKKMVETFDETVIPYLKSGYLAAKYLPGMEEYAKEMDSEETVAAFDLLSYDKQNGNSVNDNKAENNDTDNSVSLPEKSVSEEQMKAYALFVEQASQKLEQALISDKKPFGSITALRQFAKECGIDVDMEGRDDILLQELVEDAIIRAGRNIVKRNGGNLTKEVYDDIVKLYYMQPTISQRSSNRIKMQQYSTPLPMSFVADMFAGEGAESVLEPTAGNGMMVFAIPREKVHVNELDATRLAVLQPQPFMKVTNQDATLPFEGNEQYDAIIANPPFGAAPAKDYDGKMISGLDEQIALNTLSKMKDDGKAAIIIGGNMEYGPNGAIKSDKAFFTYLYDHYNVKGVIDMDGKLYAKQGTTYPTRMILIDGRRSEEERAQSKVYPPTIQKSVGYKVNTFDELYDLAEEIKNNNRKTDGNEILRTSTGIALPDTGDTSGNTDRAGRGEQSRQNEPDGRRTERGGSNGGSQTATNRQTQGTRGRHVVGVQQPGIPGLFDSQTVTAQQDQRGQSETRTDNRSNEGRRRESDNRGRSPEQNVGETGRVQSGRVQNVGTSSSGVGLTQPVEPVKPKVEEKRELETDKLSYRPHNTAFSLQSVAPAAMVEAMDANLSKIEKEHGNIDAFVTRELGYDSIEDMHNALAAEQVDSVAMAIYQMKHGQGMIIGDQTGVGKGRQMAALIRWACRQGKKPIFITKDANLFSDIYRDLVDIGSGELKPFIFNEASGKNPGVMTDVKGNVIYKALPSKAQAQVFAGHELPADYDYAVLSYSQVSTGDQISQDEAAEAAKKSGERFQKKKKKDDKPKATPKASFLRALAKDNYMFLDESHTAAGKSNTGFYFQSILKTAKAVTFASATFAKRPDTMPMYALRTAMSKAKVKAEELIKIIENGGVTLQEIMSRALTQAGQMVRRERDMSDVKTDWKTVDDPETVKKARQNYDSTIEAFNAIIDFQKNWVSSYLDRLSHDLADVAASAGMRQGTEDLGISNVPFASKTYNYTKQLMLALKVDAIVDEVVKEIEAGRHPVIALENTMGSLLSEYAPGEVIEDTTFAASLMKGLRGVLRYTVKDEDGKEQQLELKPSQLGPEGEAAYHAVEDLIRESTSGIFISPLDAITMKLQQKGYKVGELTGRNEMAVLDENTGEYKVLRRTDKDKKKLARDFNSGALDVLILNKSASTGISLHASEKFSDQRQRTMIIAQPLADINDYMQMIGRIDRTGQVARGYYINLGLPVPAEGRFLMMLSTKLKSLNANTTTSQESESNDVEAPDLLNKYGSQVVVEYLRDNPDVYIKMGEPLKKDKARVSAAELDSYTPSEDDARKITGYVALLPTKEQDAFYNDVVRRYTELIKYLNDTGSNDLKISVLPLRAKTIEKQVSSEGTDPNGDNPFAGNAYVELVDIDVLKKPMKAAEVGKVIDQLNPEVDAPKVQAKTASQEKMLNQRMTPRVRQILDIVEKEYQAKMDKEDARYEEAKARAEEAIKEQTEKINKSKRTPEQKQQAIEKMKNDKMQAIEESHNNMVNKIEASHERIVRPLKDLEVGDSYLVPDDLTTDTFFGASPAIFCGFKAKDEGITPSTTLAVFCTLDGRRKIEVKLSDWGPLTRIKNHTEQNWDIAHQVTLSNWDSQIPNESRQRRFIMTGNILQAFADAGTNGHIPGWLVTYTDIDGNVRDGILMVKSWEPSLLRDSTVPLKNRMEKIKKLPNGEHVTSADGNVVIERLSGIYTVSVPKSKKVGGQYYENPRLLNLVRGGNFYQNRGNLRADVEPENIEEVVNVLSDLGVQLRSENQVRFDTETEMGQAQANGAKRMITTHDPIEAINQAAESWRQINQKPATNSKLQEISDMVNSISRRDDLKGSAPTYVINSRQDLEALNGKFSGRVYREIERLYADPENGAAYIPRAGIVVVFGERLEDAKEAETAWWHEQTHGFWQKTPEDVRRKYGEACLEWLRKNRPDIYNHITKPGNYPRYDWLNEACAYFMSDVVMAKLSTEAFLNSKITGSNAEIINFATELRNYIKNGKGANNNQLRRVGEGEQESAAKVRRGNQQGRERGDNVVRSEEESELQEVTDPLEAIELSAKRWKKERKERIEGVKELGEYSAKQVYHERIDRATTMIQESTQDDMVVFKHGQNAIAHDKEIPDSQNAYMAANLAFGRIYNQQEQFTDIYRKPLEETIYQVCERMGWQTGDVDRYVFTKHGFERNRELFVRDWMQAERKRSATYEMLDYERQEAYDKIANRLEEQVEDGDITEEQRDKKLERALDKLWQEQLDQLQQDYVDAKEEAYQKLMKGEINFAEFVQAIDDFILGNIDSDFNAENNDCSGFTEMFGEGYKEKDILDQLMADEEKMGKDLMDKLWSQINLCSQLGLDKYRESGMISEDTYKRITNMFHFYVPMRGFGNDTAAQDHWQYMTVKDGANTIGGLLKKANGRESEANYPLSTLFSMTYKAISDGEQNMVKQKFYRLCQANPNDLVTIQDTWAVLDNTTGEWTIDYPNINADMSQQEVEARTKEFYERMNQLEKEGKAKKVKSKAMFDYKVDKKRLKEHIVEVSINGDRKTMIIKGNPRMAQALNGTLHYERGSGKWNEMVANMKQFMQSVSTSYNITFVGRNMARDWTHFGAILQAREGWDYEKAAQGYYWSQMPHMISLFKKYREGTLDMSKEMERDFKDYMDNGGITGFVHMQKVEELQKEMQQLLNTPGKVKKVGSAFWDKTIGAVEAMNEAIENNARFATYRASRHYAGRTKARSAYDSKEVTVNFNKRGAGKKTAGFKTDKKWVHRAAVIAGETAQILMANKMFFNATVQAICNIFRNIRNADGTINKKYVERLIGYYAIPPFAMGLLMPVINQALYALAGGGDDDDPYANLPEWVRRKNLCIYTGWIPGCGKNDFLVIPIGQELAAFYSMGDMMAGYTFRPSLKPVDKDIVDEMIGFFNVFSPVDFETQITSGDRFAPVSEVVGRICSPAAPLVAIGENMAWMGRPIYREDRFQGDEYTPEYQMTLGNTNSAYISLSKWLNDVSGGDDVKRGWIQINPGAMQYVFEQYVGGPGKFFMNTGSAVGDAYKAAFTDEDHDFNIRKIEFVRAFWQQGDDRTELYRAKAKYRKYRESANEYYHNLNGYLEDADTNPDHYMKAMEMSKGKDLVRMNIVREADKYLKKLNTAANQAEGKNRKNLRALYNNALAEVVQDLDKIQDIE